MLHSNAMEAETSSVAISYGSGDGKLAVAEKLDINLSGSAGFVCYGRPAIGVYRVSRSSSFSTVP